MGANVRKKSIDGGMRKRKESAAGIVKDDLLNDQEQEELITKLRDQDDFLNNIYKVTALDLELGTRKKAR